MSCYSVVTSKTFLPGDVIGLKSPPVLQSIYSPCDQISFISAYNHKHTETDATIFVGKRIHFVQLQRAAEVLVPL